MNRHPTKMHDKAQQHRIKQQRSTTDGRRVYTITSGESGESYTVTHDPKTHATTCTCLHAYWEYKKQTPGSTMEFPEWREFTSTHHEHAQPSACSHTIKTLEHLAKRHGQKLKLYTTRAPGRSDTQDGITYQNRNPK